MTVSESNRSASSSGRQDPVTRSEASAAARVRVTIDKKRGRETPQWIKDLAAR